jgi:signal transduction histidine kinase
MSARRSAASALDPLFPPVLTARYGPGGPRHVLWRRLGSVLPPLVLLPAAFGPNGFGALGPRPQWEVPLCLAAMVVVALRLRFPRSAAGAAIALCLVALLVQGPVGAMLAALVIVVYSVGRHADRRTTAVLAVTATVLVGVPAAVTLGDEWGAVRAFVQVLALVGFAAAAGDGARSRHAFIDATNDRVRRAEESKESEARSRVAEERLKIARDLHDVMAHQIAVINLNASVASQALRSRPEDAERSLSTIREASRTVLAEIASLLRVLRASDPALTSDTSAPGPVPGLGQLRHLVEGFEVSGLRVDVRVVGEQVDVPEAVDIVAYRVIQEGLTNAHKHGSDPSALLQVEFGRHLLEVTVTNTVHAAGDRIHDASEGHGLLGARERVAAVAGELTTSFGPGPVHRLVVRLPLPAPPEERSATEIHPASDAFGVTG